MHALLAGWSDRDMATLARLLGRLNQGLEQLTGPDASVSATARLTSAGSTPGSAR